MQQAMELEAPFQAVEQAVTTLFGAYPLGCVMALQTAVRHRWLLLPREERPEILLEPTAAALLACERARPGGGRARGGAASPSWGNKGLNASKSRRKALGDGHS